MAACDEVSFIMFALVILAYYAVLISLTPEVWHLNGWPALLINRIAAVLGRP